MQTTLLNINTLENVEKDDDDNDIAHVEVQQPQC